MQEYQYNGEEDRQFGLISLRSLKVAAALLVSLWAVLAQPALAVDWSGFYAGFNMGLGRGMEASLETTASAEERKTVEWCLNEASEGQVPGLDSKEKCEKPDAASWTEPDCPEGGVLNGEKCIVPESSEEAKTGCPDGYSLDGTMCVANTGTPAECGKDYELEGNLCVKEETKPAECPGGYKLGSSSDPATACVKNSDATKTEAVKCDDGYSLSAASPWTCTKKIEEDATCPKNGNLDYIGPDNGQCFATADTELTCPAGAELKSGECVTAGKEYAATAGFCTVGGEKKNGLTKDLCTAESQGDKKTWIEKAFSEALTDRDLVTRGPQTMMSLGVVAGGQFQSGNLVFGVEADADFIAGGMSRMTSKSSQMVDADPAALAYIEKYGLKEVGKPELRPDFGVDANGSPTSIDVEASARLGMDGLATVRARIGAVFDDKWLAFVTAGPAWGHVSTASTVSYTTSEDPMNPVTRTFGDERWVLGYTVGAGVNVQIAEHTRLSLEYRYTNLGRITATDSFEDELKTGLVSGSATAAIDGQMHAIRAGILFNF